MAGGLWRGGAGRGKENNKERRAEEGRDVEKPAAAATAAAAEEEEAGGQENEKEQLKLPFMLSVLISSCPVCALFLLSFSLCFFPCFFSGRSVTWFGQTLSRKHTCCCSCTPSCRTCFEQLSFFLVFFLSKLFINTSTYIVRCFPFVTL